MFREGQKNLKAIDFQVIKDEMQISHHCDAYPDEHSPYQFIRGEREEILAATRKIASEYARTFFQESELQKSLAVITSDNLVKRNTMELVCSAQAFFSALSAGNDSSSRIVITNQMLNSFEALYQTLGQEKFDQYIEKLYSLETKSSHLRIIPLIFSELHNQLVILKRFMISEMIGHGVAYRIAQNETRIKKLRLSDSVTGSSKEFSVREIIVALRDEHGDIIRDKSLMASVLTPVYEGNIPDVPTIYIAWTGTYNQSTLSADFQRNAGEESYRHAEKEIMNQVIQALTIFKSYCNKPFRITISGHSLGGALSQLLLHSLQRMLVATVNSKKNDIAVAEATFMRELYESVPHYQHSLPKKDEGLLSKGLRVSDIKEISLEIWNPTGVLQAVETHTNFLAECLSKHANVLHSSYIGNVGGDAIQLTGQGTALSDVENNRVHAYILKVEPETVRATVATAGVVGSAFFGALVFSTFFPINPVLGGVLGLALASGAVAKKSIDAHTMKHFTMDFASIRGVFNIPYRLFTSHLLDGTLNQNPTTGYLKVREQLTRKSLVTDLATKLSSYSGLFGANAATNQAANTDSNAQFKYGALS